MVIGMTFGWQISLFVILRSHSAGLVNDISHINNSRYITFVANILNSFIIAKF